MNDLDAQATNAETEIGHAKQRCIDSDYDAISREALWNTFRHWISHPEFDKDFNILEVTVLNELEFTLSDPYLKSEGWALISELAARWKRENNIKMMGSLRIASFEIVAEPPEFPPTLELLFSLATNPETRWAVFAAYETTLGGCVHMRSSIPEDLSQIRIVTNGLSIKDTEKTNI